MSKRLIIAILALFMAGVAFAQLVPTSKMEGKVADSTGAPLPGVSVEATSPRLSARRRRSRTARATTVCFRCLRASMRSTSPFRASKP